VKQLQYINSFHTPVVVSYSPAQIIILGNRFIVAITWSYGHAPYAFITARRCAGAICAIALCPSVRLSVCRSQVGVLLKRLNVDNDNI